MYPSYGDDLNNSSLMSLVGEFGIGQGMNTTDPIIYVPDTPRLVPISKN